MVNISEPHLPQNTISHAVADRNFSGKNLDFTVLPSFSDTCILNGIDTHPDMSICPLGGKYFAVSKNSFEYYKKLFSNLDITLIKGENELRSEYPFDIALNAVILNGCLFHNLKYTDKAILKFAGDSNLKTVNVKQGYTKCSTLIVTRTSVITSDEGLAGTYRENGIDVLKISPAGIILKNFDYGFIGGAGGKISADKMLFFGDITKHPDYEKINAFLKERNIGYICTKGGLTDYGSLIPLKEF